MRVLPLLIALPALASATPAPEAWRLLSTLELGPARGAFAVRPDSREARLGLILATLHEPPFSAARAVAARDALQTLVAENSSDAPALAARYQLARLHQDYLTPPDLAAATALYAALHAEHPASAEGQHAFIKLCFLRFAAAPASARAALLADAEPDGATLPDPEIRRAWHLFMAVAHLRLDRRSPDALRHSLAADALPGGASTTVADNLLRIAELARDLGQPSLAADAYARFAAARPRDARAAYARVRLAEFAPAAP